MNTQLLKLERPYNIICSKGNFAVHIATLIVVDEEPQEDNPSKMMKVARSYPVVDYGDGSPEGDVWTFSEVRNCRVVTSGLDDGYYHPISLVWFSRLLQFNQGVDIIKVDDDYYPLTPGVLQLCLSRFLITVKNPGLACAEFDVMLTFNQEGKKVTIESEGGYLYFKSTLFLDYGIDATKEDAFIEMITWWDEYKSIIRPSIPNNQYLGVVFYTDDDDYCEFVDELNSRVKEHENG